MIEAKEEKCYKRRDLRNLKLIQTTKKIPLNNFDQGCGKVVFFVKPKQASGFYLLFAINFK